MGAAGAGPEEASVGGAAALANLATPVWEAVRTNLGNSTAHDPTGVPARQIGGFLFPAIPAGVPTAIIPVAFPLSTAAPSGPAKVVEEGAVLAVFIFAGLIWALPWLCANARLCCRCWQRCLSRRLGCYFCVGLIANLTLISFVIAAVPDVSANDVFFKVVHLVELITDKLQEVLTQLGLVVGVFLAYSFRHKLVTILGFDSQLVRADLRDCLTCFATGRFHTIEVSILKATDLPVGFGTRSLFLRVVLGCNEPKHSRPRDGCTTSMIVGERMQLNYDPEDDTQKFSIAVKQQELIGGAVAQLAPAAGALVGGAVGMMTAAGPYGGAGLGAVAGIGTANSLGPEVARVDMSSSVINGLRDRARGHPRREVNSNMATGPTVPWTENNFVEMDLVPQGKIWLRIVDLPSA